MLDHFRDDARPARRGVRDVDCAVGEFNDGWGDGGEGALKRLDEVGFSRDIAKCVCGVGYTEV